MSENSSISNSLNSSVRNKSLAVVAVFVVLMWSFAGLGTVIDGERIDLSDNSQKVNAKIVSTQVAEESNTEPSIHAITSTYEYEYEREVYQKNSTTHVREPMSMRYRTYNTEYNTRGFDEVIQSRAENLEGREVTLFINPDNPNDSTQTSVDNVVSTTLYSLSVLVWIPLMIWFVRIFKQKCN
jgi:hypothetical protein